jgi:hypothetical protein
MFIQSTISGTDTALPTILGMTSNRRISPGRDEPIMNHCAESATVEVVVDISKIGNASLVPNTAMQIAKVRTRPPPYVAALERSDMA